MSNEKLAEALFDAFANADAEAVRQICSPELEARQNDGELIMLEPLIAFSLAVHGVVKNFRYEEAVRSATGGGFVEEHLVRGTLPDGSELRLPVCVVANVRDGEVTHIREYFDSASAAGLIQALS